MSLPASRIIPLVVAAALFMENLDGTVLATALPAMAADFGVAPVRLNLAITTYLVAMAVFIPVSGWLADRFGARRIFMAAIVVFLGGSVACGLAQSVAALVSGRFVQGAGGAMMVPVGRLILLRAVPRHELVNAMAWFTMPALLGPVLGPPLGGLVATHAHWRWIFWINVPIGLMGLLAAATLLPNLREQTRAPFDTLGFLASALGLSALVFAFETLGHDLVGWPSTLLAAASGVALLALYRRHARRAAAPLIDLSLLRIATFRAAVTGGSLFRLGVGALPFLLPLQLQLGFGRSALESGLTTFVAAAGAMLMKASAGRVLQRFGFRRTLTLNALVAGAFMAAIALVGPATPVAALMLLLFAGGFFRSLEFAAINTLAFADVEEARMSSATALSSMIQQLSLSAGVAIGALVLHLLDSGAPRASDFSVAFALVGGLSMAAAFTFARLPGDAGRTLLPPAP